MRTLRPLLFLVVCIVIIAMILNYQESETTRKQAAQTSHEPPEFIINGIVTTRFRNDGSVNSHFTSDHIEYFKQSDTATATRPYYILYNADGYSWHARADQASLLNNDEGAQLNGNVRIWQPERHLELTTPSLFISPERQFAKTDKPVSIKSPYGTTDSVGMQVDLDKQVLKLVSSVRGTYEKR